MEMYMPFDARPGNASQVCAEVVAVGSAEFLERSHAACSRLHRFGVLGRRQLLEARRVFVGYDQEVAGIVRKQVQHDVAGFTAPDDKILRVFFLAGDPTEQTAPRLFFMLERFDIRRAPGGKESFHGALSVL